VAVVAGVAAVELDVQHDLAVDSEVQGQLKFSAPKLGQECCWMS
jgi:hypothetical protein